MPNPLTLFPAANGYRRRLFEGRAVSVHYDHHPRNEWAAHTREEDQLSAKLDGAVGLLKWTAQGAEVLVDYWDATDGPPFGHFRPPSIVLRHRARPIVGLQRLKRPVLAHKEARVVSAGVAVPLEA